MAKTKTVGKGNAMVTMLNKDVHKRRTAVMRRKEEGHDWTVVGSSTVQEYGLTTADGLWQGQKINIRCWRQPVRMCACLYICVNSMSACGGERKVDGV